VSDLATFCCYCLLLFWQWGGTSPLVFRQQGSSIYQPLIIDERRKHCWNYDWQGKTKALGERSLTVPLCPTNIHTDRSGVEPRPPWSKASNMSCLPPSWECQWIQCYQQLKEKTRDTFFSVRGSKTESLGTAASNGSTVQASDDRWAWWIGRMINSRRNVKGLEKNLTQCHFVHHKFHTDYPGIKPRPPQWERPVTACWNYGTSQQNCFFI
jgi:hypothetical protein